MISRIRVSLKLSFLLLILFNSAVYAASFVGIYECEGYDPYLNRNYKGTITIKQQNAVYKITMQYNSGEKYKATGGQYNDELLSVVFQNPKDLRQVGLEQYHLDADQQKMGGFWVYLGKDKLGKETCVKKSD